MIGIPRKYYGNRTHINTSYTHEGRTHQKVERNGDVAGDHQTYRKIYKTSLHIQSTVVIVCVGKLVCL